MSTFLAGLEAGADWLSRYLLGRPLKKEDPRLFLESGASQDAALFVTGSELVDRIKEAIRIRRPVLVTGPRGCGKSYCSDRAIRLASEEGLVGGWRFLQGNREIPRDYLSEDMLVIGPEGKPVLLTALALRPLDRAPSRSAQELAELTQRFPEWPAVPAGSVASYLEAQTLWKNDDWTVLFLDEINRFGDGFLDSLLSLIEEGKIVRRGEEYYVPITVVATANPPGYDLTAKKLSPPLQARIARSYRVSQPPLENLVETVVASQVKKLEDQYRQLGVQLTIGEPIQYLAAASTLCLWGDPASDSKGMYFLSADTRQQLQAAMRLDQHLARAMRSIATLTAFGPDARAVSDWLGCAAGLAYSERGQQAAISVRGEHLVRTAIEVLGHKVRETFNEGTEPRKVAFKERCIFTIAERVLTTEAVSAFFYPWPEVVRALQPEWMRQGEDVAVNRLRTLLAAKPNGLAQPRWSPWLQSLRRLPPASHTDGARAAAFWKRNAIEVGAFRVDGEFVDEAERLWFRELLSTARGSAGAHLFEHVARPMPSDGQPDR